MEEKQKGQGIYGEGNIFCIIIRMEKHSMDKRQNIPAALCAYSKKERNVFAKDHDNKLPSQYFPALWLWTHALSSQARERVGGSVTVFWAYLLALDG